MLEDLRNRNQSTAEEGQLGWAEAKAVLWCPHSLWWEPVSLVTGPCWPVGARLARDWQLCHSHASPFADVSPLPTVDAFPFQASPRAPPSQEPAEAFTDTVSMGPASRGQ